MNKPGAAPAHPIILLPKSLELGPKWVSRAARGRRAATRTSETMTRTPRDGCCGITPHGEKQSALTALPRRRFVVASSAFPVASRSVLCDDSHYQSINFCHIHDVTAQADAPPSQSHQVVRPGAEIVQSPVGGDPMRQRLTLTAPSAPDDRNRRNDPNARTTLLPNGLGGKSGVIDSIGLDVGFSLRARSGVAPRASWASHGAP